MAEPLPPQRRPGQGHRPGGVRRRPLRTSHACGRAWSAPGVPRGAIRHVDTSAAERDGRRHHRHRRGPPGRGIRDGRQRPAAAREHAHPLRRRAHRRRSPHQTRRPWPPPWRPWWSRSSRSRASSTSSRRSSRTSPLVHPDYASYSTILETAPGRQHQRPQRGDRRGRRRGLRRCSPGRGGPVRHPARPPGLHRTARLPRGRGARRQLRRHHQHAEPVRCARHAGQGAGGARSRASA